jgi:hypothetical protein
VRTDPYSHSPAFCAYLLRLLHLFSSTIFSHRPPPRPLSFLPRCSRRRAPWPACVADGVASAWSRVQAKEQGSVAGQHEAGGLCLHGVRPGGAGTAAVLLPHATGVLRARAAASFSQLHRAVAIFVHLYEMYVGVRPSVRLFWRFFVLKAHARRSTAATTSSAGHHARYITPISLGRWERWRED